MLMFGDEGSVPLKAGGNRSVLWDAERGQEQRGRSKGDAKEEAQEGITLFFWQQLKELCEGAGKHDDDRGEHDAESQVYRLRNSMWLSSWKIAIEVLARPADREEGEVRRPQRARRLANVWEPGE